MSSVVPHIGGACLQRGFLRSSAMLLTTLVLLLILWLLLTTLIAVGIWTTVFSGLLILVASLILLLVVNFLGLFVGSSGAAPVLVALVVALAFVLVARALGAIALVGVLIGGALVVHLNLVVHICRFAFCLLFARFGPGF